MNKVVRTLHLAICELCDVCVPLPTIKPDQSGYMLFYMVCYEQSTSGVVLDLTKS